MRKISVENISRSLSIIFLVLTGVVLIGLQYKPEGWILLIGGILSLIWAGRAFAKDMILIYISVALLGITPITTDTSVSHMLLMGVTLSLALALPYVIMRYIYLSDTIGFGAFLSRRWTRHEWIWLLLTLGIGYLLLPYYLLDTLSYQNWTVKPGWWEIFLLFIGTNALGIWDELFFVNTVLSILRKYFPFHLANIAQATLFTSFLYELGFRGWGPVIIFPFALVQGYIFRKTQNLTYIIALHLALDFILFLALIYLHHPDWWVRIFF